MLSMSNPRVATLKQDRDTCCLEEANHEFKHKISR